MLALRLFVSLVLQTMLLAALFFVPAGTANWPKAWALLATQAAVSVASMVALFPNHRAVLEERMKPPIAADQPAADVLTSTALVATLLGAIAMTGVERHHLHLAPEPGWGVSAVGLVLVLIGWGFATRSMVDNAFAATVVRVQAERGHRVADRGLYALVRHPMYAGSILFMVGIPLALGSWVGVSFFVAPVAVILARITLEERFLSASLPGYEAYRGRVRHRLVPFVW